MRLLTAFLMGSLLLSGMLASVLAADTDNVGNADLEFGTLSGRFVYDGPPPIPNEFYPHLAKMEADHQPPVLNDDPANFDEQLLREFLTHKIRPKTVDQSLLVGDDGGIANVIVWVLSKDIPSTATPDSRPAATIQLRDGNCSPRFVALTVGQSLLIQNHDPMLQYVNIEFARALNPPVDVKLEPRTVDPPLRLSFGVPEPYPASVTFGRAPWTRSLVFVSRNPFVASSQPDGTFTLPNLPVGEWEFQVWHERAGNIGIWPKGRFIKAIKRGDNSLGTIKLKPEYFGQVKAQDTVAPLPKNREQIGEVLGKPVYRDEINDNNLHSVFIGPVMATYVKAHKAATTPTIEEIKLATKFFDDDHRRRIDAEGGELKFQEKLKGIEERLSRPDLTEAEEQKLELEHMSLRSQLKPPSRVGFAQWYLGNWKLQRHLYDEFGGGRILWQQAGQEAFDAMRTCLETLEKKGEFKITDARLRAKLYEYWTRSHGAFLTDDKERIREEFLEPAWKVPGSAKQP